MVSGGELVVMQAVMASLVRSFKWLGISATSLARFRRLLAVYYQPPLSVLGWLTHMLPYPEFMFYGPYLAVLLSTGVCAAIWWLVATRCLVKRSTA